MLDREKFNDRTTTKDGEERAFIHLRQLDVLWFNTGTLCNIECANCYIESSPVNDRLVYITLAEVAVFLDEIAAEKIPTKTIGFTGGEPFMNPDMIEILDLALSRGFEVLVLTNAMQPMMRPRVCEGLLGLREKFGLERLIMRVSLDHYAQAVHDLERGAGSWEKTLEGLSWLSQEGFRIHIAGRRLSGEQEDVLDQNYREFFTRTGITLDDAPDALVIFPEMDETQDVPEITTLCWEKLGVDPNDVMCSSSRMVVKRKGALLPTVAACTLLPYDDRFEMGSSLKEASGSIWLNHPHCARFCVLGGGSCSS